MLNNSHYVKHSGKNLKRKAWKCLDLHQSDLPQSQPFNNTMALLPARYCFTMHAHHIDLLVSKCEQGSASAVDSIR